MWSLFCIAVHKSLKVYFYFLNSVVDVHKEINFNFEPVIFCCDLSKFILTFNKFVLIMTKHTYSKMLSMRPYFQCKTIYFLTATDPPLFWDDFAESPLAPAALISANNTPIDPATCGRVNIMGNIVQDSAPYLFPFIIEYSLIGAAVIYVMWRHIGRHAR